MSLLVPHPRRTAVLVADDAGTADGVAPPGHVRLPTLWLPTAEPLVSEILPAIDVVDTDTTAVLRQVMTSGHAVPGERRESGEVALLMEFEAGPDDPPRGWIWLEVDAEMLERLDPPTSRDAIASWAGERTDGWSSRRPAWSRPGWWAEASAWVAEQMAAAGRPATGPPRLHQLWGISVVLRAPSMDGDFFFKCSGEFFRHEAVVTQALAERMPRLLPEVVAADAERGWLLMRDLGAVELGDQDESSWPVGVVAHAGIQQSWLGRVDELVSLGLPVRSLTSLAGEVEAMAEDAVLLSRMTPDLRDRWRAAAPDLAEACRQLDELGPGPTLVHGDFHPWNVVSGAGTTRVFDWTDAAVSHPCVDLATYVFRTDDVSARRRIIDAYLDAWSGAGSPQSLREAATLGLVVGALYQVQTYRSLLPTLMRNGVDDDLADGDLDWISRSLVRHHEGIDSPV